MTNFFGLGAAALAAVAGAAVLGAAGANAMGEKAAAADEAVAAPVGPAIVETASAVDFETTLSQLKAAVEKRGLKTFAEIDHAAGAASIDETLRPTTLLIFGNPRGGTPLMQSAQTLGAALPLKALVFEKANGDVAIAVIDIERVVAEHGASDQATRAGNIAGALAGIAAEAGAAN